MGYIYRRSQNSFHLSLSPMVDPIFIEKVNEIIRGSLSIPLKDTLIQTMVSKYNDQVKSENPHVHPFHLIDYVVRD